MLKSDNLCCALTIKIKLLSAGCKSSLFIAKYALGNFSLTFAASLARLSVLGHFVRIHSSALNIAVSLARFSVMEGFLDSLFSTK